MADIVSELPQRVILDEVQRVPSLFTAIKRVVDRDRAPGRFILTGSANVLLVPKLSDSLAGRMEILRLHPLAQSELGRSKPRFIDALFNASFRIATGKRLGRNLATRIAAGGYPAALARPSGRRKAAWYRDYVEALVERKDGAEADVVIERGARAVAGIEVKASATVTAADPRGLRKLRDASGKRFAAGVVLYDGEASASFGDRLFAVPVRALWEA